MSCMKQDYDGDCDVKIPYAHGEELKNAHWDWGHHANK